VQIISSARQRAAVIRGKTDAEAGAIYAAAYGADPEFYEFARSLEAYRKTLDADTTLVLPRDSEGFLKHLRQRRAPAPTASSSARRPAPYRPEDAPWPPAAERAGSRPTASPTHSAT